MPGKGSGWDGRPGHPIAKNGVWGPASCGSWQNKLLGLSDGTKQEECKFCSKAFYRESDKLQHERHCAAQPVAEPEGPPRRKVEKESTTKRKALRLDSRSRERRRSAAGMSHGAAVGEIAGQAALQWLRGCDPGSGPGITASAVLAAQEAQARLLELRAQGQAIQALLRTCQACIRRQECQNQLRRLLL